MKMNKLMLLGMIIVPSIAVGCNPDSGKITYIQLDPQEMVYAYSDKCTTTITIPDEAGCEFSDKFNAGDIEVDSTKLNGKEIDSTNTKYISNKKIQIGLKGLYKDNTLEESISIPFTLKSTAFKDNRVEKAGGTFALYRDFFNIGYRGIQYDEGDKQYEGVICLDNTFSNKQITLKSEIAEQTFTDEKFSGTVSAFYYDENNNILALPTIKIADSVKTNFKGAFHLPNKWFNNLNDGYDFAVNFSYYYDEDPEKCSLLFTDYKVYIEKI